jgi:hypothetical protein
MRRVEPSPIVDSTQMRPPCISTSLLTRFAHQALIAMLNGMVATAQRLCEAYDASIILRDGGRLKFGKVQLELASLDLGDVEHRRRRRRINGIVHSVRNVLVRRAASRSAERREVMNVDCLSVHHRSSIVETVMRHP